MTGKQPSKKRNIAEERIFIVKAGGFIIQDTAENHGLAVVHFDFGVNFTDRNFGHFNDRSTGFCVGIIALCCNISDHDVIGINGPSDQIQYLRLQIQRNRMVVRAYRRQHREGDTNRGGIAEIRIRRSILIGVVRTGNLGIVPAFREIHVFGELNGRLQSGRGNDFRSGKNLSAFTLVDCVDRQEDIVGAVGPEIRHDIQIVDQRAGVERVICGRRTFGTSVVTDQDIIGNTGNISRSNYGEGSIYQVFAAGAVTFWRRLSIGAEAIYYFGSIDKVYNMNFTDDSYRSVNNGYNLLLRGITGKFGIQYEQPLGNSISLTVGATYRLRTNVKGRLTDYSYANTSETTDTLKNNVNLLDPADGIRFGDELGVGISLKGGDKWSAEVNYLMSDWRKSGMSGMDGFSANGTSVFTSTVSHSIRGGFEIVPNRNDIRYYLKRCAYRAGVYYDTSYYLFDGNMVNSLGITLGVTLPVFRWYNGITLGVDFGQRGSLRNNMVRERYVSFAIGFNIHDLWFQKPRYN